MGKDAVTVGHDLGFCTAQLTPVFWPIPDPAHLQGKRLVLVDTPGFNDTDMALSELEILKRIAIWLASSYVDHSIFRFTRLISTHKDMALK